MAKNQERLFTADLARMLKRDIDFSSALIRGLELITYPKIMYDVSSLFPGSGVFEPKFGFLEQDIVIGKLLHVQKELGQHFYRAKKRNELFHPEIVLEIKYGDVISHQLITYSTIASRIKSIFPRSKYYLVLAYASVNIFEKLMRHGTHFDKIMYLCTRTRSQKKIPNYESGKFLRDLKSDEEHKAKYGFLVHQIQADLMTLKIVR